MRVILQPCSFRRLPKPHPISHLVPFLSDEERHAMSTWEAENVVVWGKNDRQRSRWTLIETADIALFCNRRVYFARGSVALTTRNPTLVMKFGQEGTDGEEQRNLIIYRDIRLINIPLETVNKSIGYAPNALLRQFTILSPSRSAAVQVLL